MCVLFARAQAYAHKHAHIHTHWCMFENKDPSIDTHTHTHKLFTLLAQCGNQNDNVRARKKAIISVASPIINTVTKTRNIVVFHLTFSQDVYNKPNTLSVGLENRSHIYLSVIIVTKMEDRIYTLKRLFQAT